MNVEKLSADTLRHLLKKILFNIVFVVDYNFIQAVAFCQREVHLGWINLRLILKNPFFATCCINFFFSEDFYTKINYLIHVYVFNKLIPSKYYSFSQTKFTP